MPSLRISLSIKSFVSGIRAFFNAYKKRVIAAGGVIQNEPCAIETLKTIPLSSASWVLVPSGIEEDIVFAQKPTSGLGDLTFTRASDATYTDSTGVVRRSPYNLVQFSEQFDNANWTKGNTTIGINTTTAPNGTITADSLIGNGVSTNHSATQSISLVSGVTYTLSFYAKADTHNFIQVTAAAAAFGSTFFVNFDVLNGTVGSFGLLVLSPSIQSVGDGWYRCSLSAISLTTSSVVAFGLYLVTSSTSPRLEVNTLSTSLFLWGAQLVEGTSALDYFPTTNRQDVPRIDFRNADGTLSSCGRLLLEPQCTNSIRNSSMVGAVVGTPGTLPTNWSGGIVAGLTRTIVGTGTENGLPYIDIRFNGTAASTSALFKFESLISASSGQSWTPSLYIKGISGTIPNTQLYIFEVNNLGSIVANSFITLNYSSSLTRQSFTRTLNNAATVNVDLVYAISLTTGTAYDFTIRIAAPQMELGAYATTWVPTTTAAVTRIADAASKTGVSSLIGQTEGTLFVDILPTDLTNQGRYISIESSTSLANGWIGIFAGGSNNFRFYGDNWDFAAGSIVRGTRYKVAMAYKNGVLTSVYINGTSVGTLTANTTGKSYATLKLSNAAIGNTGCCDFYNSIIFTTALSNAQLAQLTTL